MKVAPPHRLSGSLLLTTSLALPTPRQPQAALKCVAVLTVETFQPNNKRRFYRLVQDGGSFPTDLINAISSHKDDPVVVEQGVLAIEALVNKCPHLSKALREAGVEEVLESAKGVLTNSASEYPDRALAALDDEVPPQHGCKLTSGQYKAAVSAARSEGESTPGPSTPSAPSTPSTPSTPSALSTPSTRPIPNNQRHSSS